MSIINLVFSPTGGTAKVAECIASGFNFEVKEINLSSPNFMPEKVKIGSDDICIIAVPVVGGRAITASVERLSAIDGKGAKAILVAVYGNRAYEDALVELEDVSKAAGFVPCAAIAALAEHSILRKFAAGRPDAEDQAQLKAFGSQIEAAIAEGKAAPVIPGNRPYKPFNGSAKPAIVEGCNKCGSCARSCPVGAISAEQPDQTNFDKCISCMRCIYICPQQARKLDPAVLANVDNFLTQVASDRKENELFL